MTPDTPPPSIARRVLLRMALPAALLALPAWQRRADGLLHLTLLDVPGDAWLLRTPHDRALLIDGGSEPAALTAALGTMLPFWRRDLDAVILTRAGAAWLPGQIAALERYATRRALGPEPARPTADLRAWRELLAGYNVQFVPLRAGAMLKLDGALLTVVGLDAGGALLRIRYGRSHALLAHTAPAALAAINDTVDFVAFPWVSDPRIPELRALQPRTVVFTAGLASDHPALLTRAERAVGDARLLHPAIHGAITWSSDGNRTTVATAR